MKRHSSLASKKSAIVDPIDSIRHVLVPCWATRLPATADGLTQQNLMASPDAGLAAHNPQ